MAKEFLVVLRPVVLATAPSSPAKGDTYVRDSDGHLLTYDGSAWVDNGASGGGGGGGSAALVFGNLSAGHATTARYLSPGFESTIAPLTEAQIRAPKAGTLRNLRVRQRTAGTGASTLTFTVMINGVASALTCGLSNTAQDASDLVNAPSVAAGDLISVRVTKSAALTTPGLDVLATMELA